MIDVASANWSEAVALVIQFIVTINDEHRKSTSQILLKIMKITNSILFEDDSDIYDLTASDDFLENLGASQLQTSVHAPLENYELTSLDLLSGEDLFGASVTKISAELNPEWITALSVGTNFDFDLAYSSHELLTLEGNNTIYDTSTSNSLILSRDGLQDISTGSKTTDIFINSDSVANILGDASTVNLYVHENSLQNVHLGGHFEEHRVQFAP